VLSYDSSLSEVENLGRMVGFLANEVRLAETSLSRAAELPGLKRRLEAAKAGVFLHSSRSPSGCDRNVQVWRAKLGAVGAVAEPDQYRSDGTTPVRETIKVERGVPRPAPAATNSGRGGRR